MKAYRIKPWGGAILGSLALTACAPTPPPVIDTPPPPPPAPVALPKPTPPNFAAPNLVIPIMDTAGRRVTPNVNLAPYHALWNFRIGLNVAALNCRDAAFAALTDDYNAFIKVNQRPIADAEKQVIKMMSVAERDRYATRMYNYFATPPVTKDFCPVALRVANEARTVTPATVSTFAIAKLPELDAPFVNFFNAYAQYQSDYAKWLASEHPEMVTQQTAAGMPTSPAPITAAPIAGTIPVAVAASAADVGATTVTSVHAAPEVAVVPTSGRTIKASPTTEAVLIAAPQVNATDATVITPATATSPMIITPGLGTSIIVRPAGGADAAGTNANPPVTIPAAAASPVPTTPLIIAPPASGSATGRAAIVTPPLAGNVVVGPTPGNVAPLYPVVVMPRPGSPVQSVVRGAPAAPLAPVVNGVVPNSTPVKAPEPVTNPPVPAAPAPSMPAMPAPSLPAPVVTTPVVPPQPITSPKG